MGSFRTARVTASGTVHCAARRGNAGSSDGEDPRGGKDAESITNRMHDSSRGIGNGTER